MMLLSPGAPLTPAGGSSWIQRAEDMVKKYGTDKLSCKFLLVLPPFGKDKTRLANIGFTQFFGEKAPFLDSWYQIYELRGHQK